MNQPGWYFAAVAMCGCLLGFLFFNRSPAKIFMGDTGSMFLGLIIAILSINFIEGNKPVSGALSQPVFKCAPALVYALLIIPFFDTLRIFSIRIINKKSPFAADRNHIHHRLLDLKFSHMQSTGILLLINIVSIVMVSLFITVKTELLLLIDTIYVLLLNGILLFIHHKRDSVLLNQIKRLTPPKQRPKNIFLRNGGNTVLK